MNQTVENIEHYWKPETAKRENDDGGYFFGTIGDAPDQYQYYGGQTLSKEWRRRQFLAGEFEVLNDDTIKVDEGARNARLGMDDMNTGAADLTR